MLHNQKIIFVSIVDNHSKIIRDLGIRIWKHEVFVKKLLQRENCLIGKKTYELTRWKGPKTWILTRDKNLKFSGVGILHDINDIHLHTEGPLYVLGGQSLFQQLYEYVDEIHLYTINSKLGVEDWIPIDLKSWKIKDYHTEDVWSYTNLINKKKTQKTKPGLFD